MQGHIVVIGTGRSKNWDVARDSGLWASSRDQRVETGDLLFFWEANEGLKHVARATTPGQPVGPAEVLPWSDSFLENYTWKFGLEVLIGSAHAVEPSWPAVQELLGSGVRPNHAVIAVPEGRSLDRLKALFPGLQDGEVPPPDDDEGLDWPAGYDARDQAIRSVAVRRGQKAFRQALIRAYAGSCAISRCSVMAAWRQPTSSRTEAT